MSKQGEPAQTGQDAQLKKVWPKHADILKSTHSTMRVFAQTMHGRAAAQAIEAGKTVSYSPAFSGINYLRSMAGPAAPSDRWNHPQTITLEAYKDDPVEVARRRDYESPQTLLDVNFLQSGGVWMYSRFDFTPASLLPEQEARAERTTGGLYRGFLHMFSTDDMRVRRIWIKHLDLDIVQYRQQLKDEFFRATNSYRLNFPENDFKISNAEYDSTNAPLFAFRAEAVEGVYAYFGADKLHYMLPRALEQIGRDLDLIEQPAQVPLIAAEDPSPGKPLKGLLAGITGWFGNLLPHTAPLPKPQHGPNTMHASTPQPEH